MINSDKIFLIGFMGSGKSTLGKKLAQKINYSFIDLDAEIEKQEGRSIEEIFKENGEDYFRKREQDMLNQLINSDKPYVMALGGGTPCFYNNMELINRNGTSIYLKYNAGMLTSRLLEAKNERPLLKNKTEGELIDYIDRVLKEREGYYSKCKLTIEELNLKVEDLIVLLQ